MLRQSEVLVKAGGMGTKVTRSFEFKSSAITELTSMCNVSRGFQNSFRVDKVQKNFAINFYLEKIPLSESKEEL